MAELQVLEAEPVGEDVIAKLERVLVEAKAGKLSSAAIAVVYRDGYTGRAWSKAPSMTLLVGSVVRLQAAMLAEIDNG